MSNYKGVIIQESLSDQAVLQDIKIVSTEVEQVTEHHKSTEKKWTLHTVEVLSNKVGGIANTISKCIKNKWYADFKNDIYHYIIFKDRVFHVKIADKKQYDEPKTYGISLGLPEYQVDFHPNVTDWER